MQQHLGSFKKKKTNKMNKVSEFFKDNFIRFWFLAFMSFLILAFIENQQIKIVGIVIGFIVSIVTLIRIIDLKK